MASCSQGFRAADNWAAAFLAAIAPKARALRQPRSFPALLYGASRLGLALHPNLLDAITSGLLAPVPSGAHFAPTLPEKA